MERLVVERLVCWLLWSGATDLGNTARPGGRDGPRPGSRQTPSSRWSAGSSRSPPPLSWPARQSEARPGQTDTPGRNRCSGQTLSSPGAGGRLEYRGEIFSHF